MYWRWTRGLDPWPLRLTELSKRDRQTCPEQKCVLYSSIAMKLVVFILNKEELLDDVLSAYVEAGIPGATVLDSEGMGRYLTYEVPLFADFKEFMKGNKPYNKTILSVVSDERVIPELKKLLDSITGGLSQPGTGILFTIPVDYAVGMIDTDTNDEEGDK